jgi:hypothetical protein
MTKNADEGNTHPGLDPPLPILVLQERRHVSGWTRHTIHPSNLQTLPPSPSNRPKTYEVVLGELVVVLDHFGGLGGQSKLVDG